MQVIEYNTGTGTIQLHKVGCKDIAGKPQHQASPLEVTTMKAVVHEIYPPSDFEYDAETEWQGYAGDIRQMPCCPEFPWDDTTPAAEQAIPTPAKARATRRPQINHKACDHAQTPKARRECRKAFWTAKAEQAPAPVLTAQYEGLVGWTSGKGREMRGNIAKDLGTGRVQVRTATGRVVQVAFTSLRLV